MPPVARQGLISLCLLAGLAMFAAACGDDDDQAQVEGVRALPSATCEPLEFGGDGEPDVLIASDLPMQGASSERSAQMVEAIRLVLEENEWQAGGTRVAYQPCDDSVAKTGEWDEAVCEQNARAYSEDPDLVGVIGTYNSGCAALIIPILNRASGGGVAMVSPGNTLICLTQASETCDRGEPDRYFPAGRRNYARVVPNDAAQGAGLAEFARREGIRRPFVLHAAGDPVSLGQGMTFRLAAAKLGMRVAGFEAWDPEAKSYTRLMQEVKRAGADAVLLAGLLEQNGPALIEDKVSVLGPNQGRVKLLAPDGFAQQATIDDAGAVSEGMFVSVPGRDPEGLPEEGETLVSDLEQEFPDQPVELYAPYAGEAAQVMLDAIGRGADTRAAVVDALFDTEVEDGIVGSFEIDATGDPSVGPITVSIARQSFEPIEEIVLEPSLVSAARG